MLYHWSFMPHSIVALIHTLDYETSHTEKHSLLLSDNQINLSLRGIKNIKVRQN